MMLSTTSTKKTSHVLVFVALNAFLLLNKNLFSCAFVTHQPSALIAKSLLSASLQDNADDISTMATARFPTSVEDQVRQAALSVAAASSSPSSDGIKRHSIRLLLPIIGATELDDWPGGARQMMEAASPLIQDIMKLAQQQKTANAADNDNNDTVKAGGEKGQFQDQVVDETDGVRAVFYQAPTDAKDDMCAVLLPSADNVKLLQSLDEQVGEKRDLLIVNSQWRRMTDFGSDMGGAFSFFGGGGNGNSREDKIDYVEGFEPTFHCSNVMVEGNIVRILRTYPGPWRVYLQTVEQESPDDAPTIDWIQIGTKDLLTQKTDEWINNSSNSADGGELFDYGIPSYNEIDEMIRGMEGYVPKSLSERAASAFTFIKDTL